MPIPARIVDAHVHLYDHRQNLHTFLERKDAGYEAFVGNYDSLPRRYLLRDYLADTEGYGVDAIVWHEFLSEDPWKEAAWAQQLADAGGLRHALVAKVDFLDPDLEARLEQYAELPNLTGVREHMVWDEVNPLKRFAKRPDLLRDPAWRTQLKLLGQYRFKCGLEVFASQLGDLIAVIRQYPHVGFTIGVMGWPLDTSKPGFERWQRDLSNLAACDNVCMDISALECVLGMQWQVDNAVAWVHAALDSLGTSRCMFGSHLPIARLSTDFAELYRRYGIFTAGCSPQECDDLFHGVADRWFAQQRVLVRALGAQRRGRGRQQNHHGKRQRNPLQNGRARRYEHRFLRSNVAARRTAGEDGAANMPANPRRTAGVYHTALAELYIPL